MSEKVNRVLIVTDLSNFEYYCLFGAFSTWSKYSPNIKYLKSIQDTDQDNLPNLLIYDDFKRELHNTVHKRLDTINYIAKQNHQDEIDLSDGIDILFTIDDKLTNVFRKQRYPEYKAQRKHIKRQYNIPVLKDYIENVILKDLDLERRYGYKFISVEGCESDDIIATIMKRFSNYMCRILISSDHDFLQLDENINQYDLSGKKIERVIVKTKVSPKKYLLWKIIRGDTSDNISGVFKGYGEKKSLNLVNDVDKLKTMLQENQDAARQFKLNKMLIDFDSIPKETTDVIYKKVSDILLENRRNSIFINLEDINNI